MLGGGGGPEQDVLQHFGVPLICLFGNQRSTIQLGAITKCEQVYRENSHRSETGLGANSRYYMVCHFEIGKAQSEPILAKLDHNGMGTSPRISALCEPGVCHFALFSLHLFHSS